MHDIRVLPGQKLVRVMIMIGITGFNRVRVKEVIRAFMPWVHAFDGECRVIFDRDPGRGIRTGRVGYKTRSSQ
jgi:hypothetical protein